MAVAAVYWWSVVEMLILTVSVSATDGSRRSGLVVSGREVDPNSVCVYYRWQCTGGQW